MRASILDTVRTVVDRAAAPDPRGHASGGRSRLHVADVSLAVVVVHGGVVTAAEVDTALAQLVADGVLVHAPAAWGRGSATYLLAPVVPPPAPPAPTREVCP